MVILSVTYKRSLSHSVYRYRLSVYHVLEPRVVSAAGLRTSRHSVLRYTEKPPPCTLSPLWDTWRLVPSSPTFIKPGPPPMTSVCFKTGMIPCWQSCMRVKWHASSEKAALDGNYTLTRVLNYPRAHHCPKIICFRKRTICVN